MKRLYSWAWQRALAGRTGALTRVFMWMIPFNKPHRFQIVRLQPGTAAVSAALTRANRNHIGTMHACALATIGEFAAGLALLGAFSPTEYRLIMSRLEVDYLRRADGPVTAESALPDADRAQLQGHLQAEGKAERVMTAHLRNGAGDLVAEVRTHWQMKAWGKVGRA